MPKFNTLLLTLLLPLFAGCATIDEFLFDAYPDGTPINRSKNVESPATEPAVDPKQQAEAEALREEIRKQQAELEAIKAQKAAEAAAAREQLWVRVSFRSGQTGLTSETKKSMQRIAKKFLAQPQTQRIMVRGYCDDEPIGGYSGGRKSAHNYNSQIALSQARADAIANELKRNGIPAGLIESQGFGATAFIAGNDTVEGRNKNRRVDIFLIGNN